MMKQIFALALSVLLLALSVPVQGQQAAKVSRIDYLAARSSPEPRAEGFRRGLRDFGCIEGKNDD